MTNLTDLDLHDNHLTHLPDSIGQLTRLTSLDLACNQLTSLPPPVGQLTNLATLDLRGNQFITVPSCVFNLPENTEVLLYGNPIHNDEIHCLREALRQRQAVGLPAPRLRLPEIEGEDAGLEHLYRQADEVGLDVRAIAQTDAMRERISELAAQFPNRLEDNDGPSGSQRHGPPALSEPSLREQPLSPADQLTNVLAQHGLNASSIEGLIKHIDSFVVEHLCASAPTDAIRERIRENAAQLSSNVDSTAAPSTSQRRTPPALSRPGPKEQPLLHLDHLAKELEQAGCSASSIEKFKENWIFLENPDPKGMYAQNITRDLQANYYESVEKQLQKKVKEMELFKNLVGSLHHYQAKWARDVVSLENNPSKFSAVTSLVLSRANLPSFPRDHVERYNGTHERSVYDSTLPREIGLLTNLTDLYIYDSHIASLPPEFAQLANLTNVNLSGNRFRSISPEVFELKNLNKLNLERNRLISLPPEIGNAKQLDDLLLEHNQLSSLPPEIGQLTNLTMLGLNKNQLTSLPTNIGGLTNLTSLDVKENLLDSLPTSIGNLTNLIELNAEKNNLAFLPQEIGDMTNLSALLLTDNNLNLLPATIGNLKNLTRLCLSENQLDSVPSEIGNLTALDELRLADNNFDSMPPEIERLTQLRLLDFDINQLTSIPEEIGKLTNLQQLFLRHNELTDLPHEISLLTNLFELDLSDNEFFTVPDCLLDLPADTEINLIGNPLPGDEIRRVLDVLQQRRDQNLPVPRLILPHIDGEAFDVADAVINPTEQGIDVHDRGLTRAVRARVNELKAQFPGHLDGGPAEGRAEMINIKQRLEEAITRYGAHHRQLPAARISAARMFATGLGEERAFFNEFQLSAGHVLAYAFLSIERQCDATPEQFRNEARSNGINYLIGFLADGVDRCDTRKIGEVFQLVGMPLSAYAAEHPEIVGVAPPALSPEAVRDITFPIAIGILKDTALQTPALAHDDDALRNAFRTALFEKMTSEHPAITQQQLTDFLNTQILAAWEDFKSHCEVGLAQ